MLSLDNIGFLHLRSAAVDEFGWTLRKVQFMETQNLDGESQIYIQKWKHYDMHWRACFSIRHIKILELTAKIWLRWLRSSMSDQALLIYFPDFKITHVPRAQNGISDSSARTTRFFHRDLCFIGCLILVTQTTSRLNNKIDIHCKKNNIDALIHQSF